MKRPKTLDALALLFFMAGTAATEECGGTTTLPARLSLAWQDDGHLVADLLPGIERELRDVLVPLGVTIDWRVAAPGEAAPANEIRLVLVDDPRAERLGKGVLGAVRRGAATRRARVFLAPVEGLLKVGAKARKRPGSARGRRLARALGRVAAHELVHVIVPDLGHTGAGLMQASWTRSILAASRVALDRKVVSAVRNRLSPSVPPSGRYASETPSSSCTRSL